MEKVNTQKDAVRVYYDPMSPPPSANSAKISRLFVQRGQSEPRKVTVKPEEGGYFELKGMVDSQWDHDIVLSIVQTSIHSWRVIDRMTVANVALAG